METKESEAVYAVIRVQTALRKKDGTVYMTGVEDERRTRDLQFEMRREAEADRALDREIPL